jgi:purine-binding chemotaxis protein CheW
MADFSDRLLLVRAADLLAAIEAASVREILSMPAATRIPGAPAEVLGLINVRGELVTLIHGRRLLGRAGGSEVEDTAVEGPLVLLSWGGVGVGVVVDEVVDLVPAGEVEMTPREELPGIDPRLVRAVGLHGGRSFLILDLDALFRPLLAA